LSCTVGHAFDNTVLHHWNAFDQKVKTYFLLPEMVMQTLLMATFIFQSSRKEGVGKEEARVSLPNLEQFSLAHSTSDLRAT